MIDMQKTEEAESTSAITINIIRKRSLEEHHGKKMRGNNADFKIVALEKMSNLMLLQLNYVTFSGTYKKLPKKLRLLRWHGCTLKAIPSDICLEKLVVLDMSHSKLKRLWDGFKFIGSLTILNLSYSVDLITTPDFGGLPGLESLILEGCSSLIKVDESIASLPKLVLLDLTGCTSLIKVPCFPTSIVSLQMSGCGVLGRVQSLDLASSFSNLEHMDFSYCNLFDNSFPDDWSSLISLEYLNISGNHITFLPKCIQKLPTIQDLSVEVCLDIQSILGLPESLQKLYARGNESLEKIQLTQNQWAVVVYHTGCPKFCEIEGRYKVQSIDNVEKKIIQNLGLESNAGERMELGIQVLHEFGIFSTFVSENQIPSSFTCKERGPQISFEVPWHDSSSKISGLNLCVVLSQSSNDDCFCLEIQVYNKTKDLLWKYYNRNRKMPWHENKYAWLSLWRCGNLLEGGDEIFISIIVFNEEACNNCMDSEDSLNPEAVECCVNLIYEDDERLFDRETKEAQHANVSDQISWTDRMHTNISDYIEYGSEHSFGLHNWYQSPSTINGRADLDMAIYSLCSSRYSR